jgi:uncharacterized protein YjbJ (UPF0337 family)
MPEMIAPRAAILKPRFWRRSAGNAAEEGKSRGEVAMGDNIDEAKGRVKEAAGDLSDDPDLKKEGRVDKAVSDVKEKVDDIADKVKDRIGSRDDEADTDRT